jgi:hypothetical protein
MQMHKLPYLVLMSHKIELMLREACKSQKNMGLENEAFVSYLFVVKVLIFFTFCLFGVGFKMTA